VRENKMMELTKFTIAELKEKIVSGEISPSEVTESYLQNIAKHNEG
jgi:Asp-tRNA(Asn)/Glu-tRNA(Gln) amidotransferase A subunit family amidase